MKNTKRSSFFRPTYGNVVSPITNFSMPFHWNREFHIDKHGNQVSFDWTKEESLLKEIEKESMWRDYFTAKGDQKESNKSFWRAKALKDKLEKVKQEKLA